MALICIYLIISGREPTSIHLVAICLWYLERFLLKSLDHFQIGLLFFYYWVRRAYCVFWTYHIMYGLLISLPFYRLPFQWLVLLQYRRFLVWCSPLVYCLFCSLCFWHNIHDQGQCLKAFPHVFFWEFYSFKSYIYILIPFLVDICVSMQYSYSFILLHGDIQFSHLLKEMDSHHSCERSFDWICGDLFLGFLFCYTEWASLLFLLSLFFSFFFSLFLYWFWEMKSGLSHAKYVLSH